MSFDEDTVQKVWGKGRAVSGNDPNRWRKDDCNAWIEERNMAIETHSMGGRLTILILTAGMIQ